MKKTNLWQNIKANLEDLLSVRKIDDYIVVSFLGIKFYFKHKTSIRINELFKKNTAPINKDFKIIASLTLSKSNIDSIHKTIISILNQSLKPDKVILWLPEEYFPNKSLPVTLTNLEKFGLTIRWTSNLCSYNKIIPAINEFPNDIIITFDDGILYDIDTVKSLYNEHLNYPDSIICTRTKLLLPDKKSHSFKVIKHHYSCDKSFLPSYFNLPDEGAILYPCNSLYRDVTDYKTFILQYPSNFNNWIWANAIINKTKIASLKNGYKLKQCCSDDTNIKDMQYKLSDESAVSRLYKSIPEIRAILAEYTGDSLPAKFLNDGTLKISVIVPAFNAEKYIKEAINSVLRQSLKDIEIICINDGSTDTTLDILKKYETYDSRIRVIDKENSGYGATVNLGIEEAKGEYIAIFEPDDILDENIYEILYNNAKQYNVEVVKCNFYNYWSKTNTIRQSKLIEKCAKPKPFSTQNNLRALECHASVWAGIYKKSFLQNNNIKFLETPGASFQDMSFTFKIYTTASKIMLLKQPLLFYRQDNPNSSINNPNKIFCVCDEYKEISNYLNLNKNLKQIFNTQKLINQYRGYLWNLNRLNKSFHNKFLSKFSEEFCQYYKDGEINADFFKSVNKSQFKLLINDPDKFYKNVICN